MNWDEYIERVWILFGNGKSYLHHDLKTKTAMENIAIIIVLLCGKGITHFRKGAGHAGLPPMITSEFETEYFFPAAHSTSLTLQCQAENGNITYEWYKNFMKLEDNQRVTYDWDTGEIIFTNLSNEDFGMYYCLAKNEFGASISAFFNISETRIDSFPIFKERDHTCQEFHYCKLSCSDKPFCVPKNNCRIEWKIGSGTSNNVDIKENMELDREGNLHFLNINQSYGAKNYYCGVWNENERIFRKGNLLNLDVKDSADSFVPPRAVYQSGYKAFVGENATLQCIFSGNPVPKVTWQYQEWISNCRES
ncbi:neural cell adhesion molecule L1-like [Saccostrea echinata]|uniref:neural cell adhesion molecule L1-like n=1 Tax=Saccostrea echinata TaxID=191078 RepID=UPI002A81A610|nr:neural cell adhesion molecule L1-like [Saccostrea echinata]